MRLPAARWAELVATQRQSGLTIRQFAAQHHVNESTLSWWRGQLQQPVLPAFVEVPLPAVPPVLSSPSTAESKPVSMPLRVELVDRRVALTVPVDTDLAWLRAVVDALS